MKTIHRLAPALALVLAACFDPQIPEGLDCSPAGTCPPDQECRAGTCVLKEDSSVDLGKEQPKPDLQPDLAPTPDMAQAPQPDLAEVPDLAPPPDLTPAPDLEMPADMAQNAKTTVTIAESDQRPPVHTTVVQDTVGVFIFKSTPEPGSLTTSTITTMTVKLLGNLIGTGVGDDTGTIYIYSDRVFDNAHLMGKGTLTGLDASTSAELTINITSQNEFFGTKEVFVVTSTVDDDFVDTAFNTEHLALKVTGFCWNDGVAIVCSPNGMPVYGDTYAY